MLPWLIFQEFLKKVNMATSNSKYLNILSNISNARTQKLISIVLTLIALTLFGLFAINPTLSTIAKLRKEIDDYEVINQKLQDKIFALNSLQQAYSDLEIEVPTVLKAIPDSPLVPLFIGQIQSIAKDTNISVVQIQNSKVDLFKEFPTADKYHAYSFTFTGDGTYENIIRFIENVTNMQRVVGIDTSSIYNVENNNETLRLNFQGITYYKI